MPSVQEQPKPLTIREACEEYYTRFRKRPHYAGLNVTWEAKTRAKWLTKALGQPVKVV